MFAERLKHLRRSRELNQVQLARGLGVRKQSVSNWENDNIMPSVEMLERVANFFEVTTDYLLGRNEGLDEGLAVDVTGLNRSEIDHIRQLVEDLRKR
ncbi:MAG TPA: helix-turn-helix domain-containing protein [Candidatus Lachnoclostridium avicola]|nr:helix-turn-helix domain-containing protein [Candidatus Lachnoclostridium avicola]